MWYDEQSEGMEIDDQIQSEDLQSQLIMTNLKVYLEQPIYSVNKDGQMQGFIKVIDLKAAFVSLKCDSVSLDDINSLVTVITQMIFEDRVDNLT